MAPKLRGAKWIFTSGPRWRRRLGVQGAWKIAVPEYEPAGDIEPV